MFFEEGSLLNDLIRSGLELTVTKAGVSISGFYKSGHVTLTEESGAWVATDRYNEKTEIASLGDLVRLNYTWWQRSKRSFDGWASPDPKWLPLLEEKGCVTKSVEIKISYS